MPSTTAKVRKLLRGAASQTLQRSQFACLLASSGGLWSPGLGRERMRTFVSTKRGHWCGPSRSCVLSSS